MDTQKYTPHWNLRSYTQDMFTDAWINSRSISECAKKLNLTIYGSTYKTLKATAKSLNLTSDHMVGQGWRSIDKTTKSGSTKKPIEYYLVVDGQMSSSTLKSRLIREGILYEKCAAPFCPSPETTIDGLTGDEVKTPLTLDHINGINNDNRVENLRLLCANCDRMNPTFARGSGSRKKTTPYSTNLNATFCSCGSIKSKGAKRCMKCYKESLNNTSKIDINPPKYTGLDGSPRVRKPFDRRSKIDWPDNDRLLTMVRESSYVSVGESLGVSDNAVRKRLKLRGLI